MKNHWILAALGLLAVALYGCDRTPDLDVRTFTLEHRSGYEAAELIDPYIFYGRTGAPGAMSPTDNAISVRETADNLDRIARVLEDFDKAIPGLKLRFQVIEADSFQDPDPAIADVVEELRGLFRFEGYRLLGEAVVSVAGGTQEGQEFRQSFLGTEETFLVEAGARVQRPGTVRLNPIKFWRGFSDVLLETSVNVSTGQTVVIGGGKAREGGRSFILTVSAESG